MSTTPMTKIREARIQGKTVEALLKFFYEGKKGKAIIYATPEGDFLTPQAVKNLLRYKLEKLEGEIEKMKTREDYDGNDLNSACDAYGLAAENWSEVIRFEDGRADFKMRVLEIIRQHKEE